MQQPVVTPSHNAAGDHIGWQVIFRRDSMPEHYSINDKLTYLVQRFLDESK